MKLTFLGTRGEIEARTRRHHRHSSLLVSYRGKPRAQQTAELLRPATRAGVEAVVQHDGLAPKDPVEPIQRELEQGNSNVMIVGHLPLLGRLAALLLTGDADKEVVAFQFGCVVCLSGDDSGRWKLEWMMVPELL